jgi:hypothetical protein
VLQIGGTLGAMIKRESADEKAHGRMRSRLLCTASCASR